MTKDDDISEAKYLELQSDGGADEDCRELEEQEIINERVNALKGLEKRFTNAHQAEVGATIQCAQCGKLIIKKSYQKKFCSNQKTHGKNNCKDKYYNRVNGLKKYLNET